jgi:GH15 family glucan-1,4-alpha-glucosidase
LLDDAVRFVGARLHEDGPKVGPAHTVDGGPVPDQRTLGLPGYPVLAAAARQDRLDRDGRQAAEIAVAAIGSRWSEPDAGTWELADRAWTHSRLICAAGLRRIADVAPDAARKGEWIELADTILAHTTAHAVRPDGHWQRAPDDTGLDAALLLPPVRGLLPADGPRTRATLRAYTEKLTSDHYAYRFRHDERPLEEAEGAFLLCGFVTALAEHRQGRKAEAYRWFERNRHACGAAGLYSEEYDIAQRQLRGNLPQAFVHALMLETAATLARDTPA